MKEIKAYELKVGDIFIDTDTYATIDSEQVHRQTYMEQIVPCVKVKRIVGPTDIDQYIDTHGYYYLHLDSKVILLVRDGEQI